MTVAVRPPTIRPTPPPIAVVLATVPMVLVRPEKWRRAARRLKAKSPAPPPTKAAVPIPPVTAPNAAPPAMIATVRDFLPNQERCFRFCAEAGNADIRRRTSVITRVSNFLISASPFDQFDQ